MICTILFQCLASVFVLIAVAFRAWRYAKRDFVKHKESRVTWNSRPSGKWSQRHSRGFTSCAPDSPGGCTQTHSTQLTAPPVSAFSTHQSVLAFLIFLFIHRNGAFVSPGSCSKGRLTAVSWQQYVARPVWAGPASAPAASREGRRWQQPTSWESHSGSKELTMLLTHAGVRFFKVCAAFIPLCTLVPLVCVRIHLSPLLSRLPKTCQRMLPRLTYDFSLVSAFIQIVVVCIYYFQSPVTFSGLFIFICLEIFLLYHFCISDVY